MVAIIGILAAIAIPGYADYTTKAQASETFVILDGLKTTVADQMSQDPTACVIVSAFHLLAPKPLIHVVLK